MSPGLPVKPCHVALSTTWKFACPRSTASRSTAELLVRSESFLGAHRVRSSPPKIFFLIYFYSTDQHPKLCL